MSRLSEEGKRRRARLMTKIEAETLMDILMFIRERKYPPSLRDLGDLAGVTPQAIRYRVMNLDRKGYLEVDLGVSRGIRVTEKGRRAFL